MPRTFSAPERRYAPGEYGPLEVDNLTNANTDALEWSMTVGADWPSNPAEPVVHVSLAWDTGDGMFWTYNGGLKNRDGAPRTLITNRAYLPQEGDGRGGVRRVAVAGGTIRVIVFWPITTAVVLAAV